MLVILSGCAHKTVHEECSDAGIVSKYKDYDQCYSERVTNRQIDRAKRPSFAQSFSQGFNKQPVNCTSSTVGGITNTNCY